MQTGTDKAIPATVRREIETRLDSIEQTYDVRILLAVESGSRAWGFPSPDSDYDVRFLYVRARSWYLSLKPGRDVIETPIEDEIDLNGWDIRKALGLMLRSNAVVSEWIESPIRYRADHPVVARLSALADRAMDARGIAHHYANLGQNAADRWLTDNGDVPVKKYFYALRPALAIRCLRLNRDGRPPMDLQTLVDRCALSEPMRDEITKLVEAKRRSNEQSNATRIAALDDLIRDELLRAGELPVRETEPDVDIRADQLFLELVNT
ncbi:nucleotidyltransferase domain-containing protein [Sandaracinobacter sp. RS1-74]|uniref:nucleotidyltransferase domain-containing protein n=1 Tax=Sandaracinobacteroides sayramensis TaxID=2913411 RepID=UPI001ED9F060|nr:nucleotidyltransferase domain-containing protein [Sandaracinobacteroides sayramensis]MCG2840624.1 nucleotidyltransferase domain-containing protein [Sandaracinobacteroides sayramensis]